LWGRTRVEEDGLVTEPNAATNGVIGGVLAGYNWQAGPWVFGIEGDFGWTDAHGTGQAQASVTLPKRLRRELDRSRAWAPWVRFQHLALLHRRWIRRSRFQLSRRRSYRANPVRREIQRMVDRWRC